VFEWRGPAPYHFIAIVGEQADELLERSSAVTYGWGMVPVECRLGSTRFTTSLWPKGDAYYLPLKDAVRRSESVEIGDVVTVDVEVRMP
jgi:hypothetical protein